MIKRFILFGYEISIKPVHDLHVTHFPEEEKLYEEPWKHDFPISKRIHVFTGDNTDRGFIEYVFRNYGLAILTYRETAMQHLETILTSFKDIRDKFSSKGATEEQLTSFDEKICDCFENSVNVVRQRVKLLKIHNHQDYEEVYKLLKELESYKIEDYYKTV